MKKTKKLLALLLAVCMLLSLSCTSVFAEGVEDGGNDAALTDVVEGADNKVTGLDNNEDGSLDKLKEDEEDEEDAALDEGEEDAESSEDDEDTKLDEGEEDTCEHEWDSDAVEGGTQYTCALCGESHFLPDDDDAFSVNALEEGEAEDTCAFTIERDTDDIHTYKITGEGEFAGEFLLDGNQITVYELYYTQPYTNLNTPKKLIFGEGITGIADNVFKNNRVLEEVELPASLTSIGNQAFYNTALGKINLEHVTSVGYEAFALNGPSSVQLSAPGVTEITIPAGMTEIGVRAFSHMYALKTVTVSEGVTSIDDEAFFNNGVLESVVLPQSLETIGKDAFSGCNKLTTISMTGEEAKVGTAHIAGVSSIGVGALNGVNMTELVLDDIGTIGDTGYSVTLSCPSLTDLTLNNVGTVGSHAFYWTPALRNVTMNDVGSVGKLAFYYDTALQEVSLTNVKVIGDQAFYGYNGNWSTLTKVTIYGTDTIGTQAFAYNYYLKELSLDNIGTIGQQAFYYDAFLPSITMGEVSVINQYAFLSCTGLSSIDSLENVGRIDGFAFYGCSNLTCLTVEDATKMGFNGNYGDVMARVEKILKGEFTLGKAPDIVRLSPDEGWGDSKWDKNDSWNSYDNQTQLVEQARWTNEARTEAEVKVDAYYTAEKQMDYIFVADLSASMAQLGNAKDENARFYDMQSKLLDMTSQLLGSEGYDCRVAIVTFGGALNATTAGTSKTMDFNSNAAEVKDHISGLTPLYENTDYGLGMQEALRLVKANTGRNTVVVFLSDGQPYTPDGVTPTSNELTGTTSAEAIRAQNVPIYGVLHSPGAVHDQALAAMKAVCGENTVYESTDTKSFGEAMNAAFTAVYGTYTVTIPVGENYENVRELTVSASAGEASYDEETHTITWTITGMPFTKHTLTYRMSLVEAEANSTEVGSHTYAVNSGIASIEGGVSVESPVLSREVAAPPPSGGGGGGGGVTPVDDVEIDDTDVPLAGDVNLNMVDHFAYVFGYPDGSVRPLGNITREEVATIFYRLLTDASRAIYASESNDFSDVDESRWSNEAISTLANAGIVNGYEDGTFRPGKAITRAEFAAIAARFEDVTDGLESPFSDTAGHWAENLIAYSANRGWITGYDDGTFRPNQDITRAEAMTMINNVLVRHVDEEGLLANAKQWPDNTADSWYYFPVLEATNGHTYERRAEDSIMENWLELNVTTPVENDEN